MRFLIATLIIFAFSVNALSQNKMDKTLKKFNKESVPYIEVDALNGMHHVVLLDAREREEFEVSHLKDAIFVGYKEFQMDSISLKIDDKSTEIIVYCSIGVRSENIGEKLRDAGYTNVKNLYGGIFEWKNKGYPVYNSENEETEKVHAFNKYWGKLLKEGKKVYGPMENERPQ